MLTWRAVRARSGQSLALFAMGVVVVAGCVAAAGYSRATAGSVSAAGPLLLLGAVALAGQGAASARSRRSEIALAQLHGRDGLRLLRAAVTEPTLILVAAAVAGTALGWLGARAAVHRWADRSAAFSMSVSEWATAAGVLAVSVVVVVVVSWHTTYEPLTDKLRAVERPRAATAATTFLSLLVLLGAAVSVYQARQLGVGHAGWVSFLSPVLLGLAAGQIGVWLVALGARLAVGSAGLNRGIGWFVTLRRLTRVSDSGAVIRIVVAAVAVAGVAGSAWVGADSWRTSTARMQTGGPVTYVVPDGGLQAYAASHAADPHGRWLMAMSGAPDPSGGSYRDVFVDAPRWRRVVGDFFAGTPLAAVSSQLDNLLPAQAPEVARGSTVTVTLSASSVRRNLPSAREVARIVRKDPYGGYMFASILFEVVYVDSHGATQSLYVPAHTQVQPTLLRPGVVAFSAPIRAPGARGSACVRACTVTQVNVQGLTHPGAVRVTGITFGDLDILPLVGTSLEAHSTRAVHVTASPRGLDLELGDPYSTHPVLISRRSDIPAAFSTPGIQLDRSGAKPLAYGVDGVARPVRIAAEVTALPLLGRQGVLLDLGTALRGAGGQIPNTETVIVARADTPQSVLGALHASGAIGKRQVVEQALSRIRRSGTAQGTLLYTLIAGFGLLIALLSVISAVAEQRRDRRREAASLRVVGVDSRIIAQGYRAEAELLGVAVAVIAGIAVWAACRALLGVLPLVDVGEFGLPFDPTPRLGLVAGAAAAAGLVVALAIFLAFRQVGRSSPPQLLREDV